MKNVEARVDGYYSKKGEKLKHRKFTQAYCDEFNGKKAAQPVVEPVVVEAPVAQVTLEEVANVKTVKPTTIQDIFKRKV